MSPKKLGRAKGPAPTPPQPKPQPEEGLRETLPDDFLEVEISYAPVDTASGSSDTTKSYNAPVDTASVSSDTTKSYNAPDDTASLSSDTTKSYHAPVDTASVSSDTTKSYDASADTASVSSDTTTKRERESKKEIPEYKWTDESTKALAEYIKEHHCLYDKGAKLWQNLQAKNALWEEIGLQLNPPASGKYNK